MHANHVCSGSNPRPSPPACPPACLPARAGANWVDPPKRERKRVASYAENEFYRMAMQKREYGPRNTGPKLPKMPALQASLGAGRGRHGRGGRGELRGLVCCGVPSCVV